MARDRLGREIFIRGMPEPINVVKLPEHADTMYDLLTAYSAQRVKRSSGLQLHAGACACAET